MPCACASCERVGHLLGDVERALDPERTVAEQGRDGRALDELHRDVAEPLRSALDLAGLVDDGNVRVIQRGSCACFGQQAGATGFFRPAPRAQHLERDDPAELEILGAIDIAHAARAEVLEHAVVREGLADHHAIITGSQTDVGEPIGIQPRRIGERQCDRCCGSRIAPRSTSVVLFMAT